jgi:SET domain
MEYLHWQLGGGGLNGLDPLYHFSLKSIRPSKGAVNNVKISKKEEQRFKAAKKAAAAAIERVTVLKGKATSPPLFSKNKKNQKNVPIPPIRSMKTRAESGLSAIVAASTAKVPRQKEDDGLQEPQQKRQKVQFDKAAGGSKELKSPSAACAKEIKSLVTLVNYVALTAGPVVVVANEQQGNTAKVDRNYRRHFLAKHLVESGIATERVSPLKDVKGVFYEQTNTDFANFTYTEQSKWCGEPIGKLKKPSLQKLREHGACLPDCLRSVLQGQWPYKVWIGDMKNTALLPAGIGVVALEDIPAGSFVAQFIGEYISSKKIPSPSLKSGSAAIMQQQSAATALEYHRVDKKKCYAGENHNNNIAPNNSLVFETEIDVDERYRVRFPRNAECVLPISALKTEKQRNLVNRISGYPSGKNASINNDQWRTLENTIIDSKHIGNATRFMRPSQIDFNLARVDLIVPNGPTKVLYYAKKNIVKGEELVREP